MRHEVFLTTGARYDLEDIYDYIATSDSRKHADHVLDQLMGLVQKLIINPNRGSYPKELAALGIHEYRQVFFKPYRVIYRVIDKRVIIYLIVDGRRDLQSLLIRRFMSSS
ncbi:MAG: type II toxin-antitoxin system RelE/ParE family toxin [Gammaproteobacteria bacterium]|nr:type II toxin-antitoxin system RelE/ParE family toxin [Gammaproteobacteria bacterium]